MKPAVPQPRESQTPQEKHDFGNGHSCVRCGTDYRLPESTLGVCQPVASAPAPLPGTHPFTAPEHACEGEGCPFCERAVKGFNEPPYVSQVFIAPLPSADEEYIPPDEEGDCYYCSARVGMAGVPHEITCERPKGAIESPALPALKERIEKALAGHTEHETVENRCWLCDLLRDMLRALQAPAESETR